MAFLTKETADALCTIIALGFAASEFESSFLDKIINTSWRAGIAGLHA
ncbi:MAG: hypothetical protein LBK83_06040 [Treponema sp.]|jgi:hypothetical protein|nr:hypothetical protein [Treponema sp.]